MEQERKERRARASEADAERLRRLMGGASRRRDDHNNWESGRRRHRRSRSPSLERLSDDNEKNDRSRRSKKRHHTRSRSPRRSDDKEESSSSKRHRVHDDDNRDRERRHRKRAASPSSQTPRSSSRSKKRSKHHDEDKDSVHSRRDKRSRSKSSSRSSKKESLKDKSSIPTPETGTPDLPGGDTTADDFVKRPRERSSRPEPGPSRVKSPRRKEPASPTLSEEEDIERMRPRRRARPDKTLVDPERSSPGAVASKMDKYFESSYDPRLDIEPMTLPTVPTTGLIDGTEFERWEAMLDVIRQRREDKLERKRLERQGLLPDKGSSKKAVIKGEMASSSAWNGEAASMMDIQYSKRGAVREWDMGKEGF